MKIIKIGGVVVGLIVAGTVATLFILNPQNYAETSEDAGDNALLTRRFKTVKDISALVEDLKFLLSGQTTYGRNWKVAGSEIENDSAVIKAEVPIVIFTDDLEVRLNFAPSKNIDSVKNEIVVNVRSASRVGNSDFGENRRHIKQILEKLDLHFLEN